MPIRFRCEYCGSRLSVASRKAGLRAKCPKCTRLITIPEQGPAAPRPDLPSAANASESLSESKAADGGATSPAADSSVPGVWPESSGTWPPPADTPQSVPEPPPLPHESSRTDSTAKPPREPKPPVEPQPPVEPESPIAASGPAADPYARFLVYDDETELVYEDLDSPAPAETAGWAFDPAKVTVPRRLLYLQGILLGVVALAGFALGVLTGTGASSVAVIHEPVSCVVFGRIALKTASEDTIMDRGAVAMIFPQGARPETKLEIVGLRPRDPEPRDDHPAILAIRSLGGDYARADQDGAFRLRVPDRGKYFVLVISASRRGTGDEIPRTIRAQLGRFFQLDPDLFAGYDYRWQEETVRGDRQLNFVF
jgi:phage FluMu protein Com